MKQSEHFEIAETLRATADKCFQASQGYDDLYRQNQILRREASGHYARAGVALTPGGEPFGPDIRDMRRREA